MDVEVAEQAEPLSQRGMEINQSQLVNRSKPMTAVIGNRQQQLRSHHFRLGKRCCGYHEQWRLVNYFIIILQLTVTISTYLNVVVQAEVNLALSNDDLPPLPPPPSPSSEVSQCEACRLVVDSFENGMKETARGKHEGGDTSWEEKNLKSYQDSEVRLIEIQERICEDVKAGKAQCLSLAEDTEAEVENWWFNERPKKVRLFDYLCINKLKRCCAQNTFGPNCKQCQSDCAQHGTCDGEGTRLGSGKCLCDKGYTGDSCDHCSEDHFKVTTSNQFACRECDLACDDCYGPGPTNCTQCRSGYYKHETNGCIDIDECDEEWKLTPDKRVCKGSSYCINTNGSYRCAGCHIACAKCVAYGAEFCSKCSEGYKHDSDFVCRTKEEMEELGLFAEDDETWAATSPLVRWFFYLSVLMVSVIIFRSNAYVMYIFLFGFILALAMSEFKLLHHVQDYTKVDTG